VALFIIGPALNNFPIMTLAVGMFMILVPTAVDRINERDSLKRYFASIEALNLIVSEIEIIRDVRRDHIWDHLTTDDLDKIYAERLLNALIRGCNSDGRKL
jgi:hypothetical protein